ncbi:hypothetical protein L6164_024597 [Bauhinia variegata]|uniref:Uncharacterized protein n=1 Tax=Bauhinia variegata TaxID=167791 RepID=A0ACB9LXQ6_BAUVA|nr:hypothetical protein L6164_024597 [Bauhinia variegata]
MVVAVMVEAVTSSVEVQATALASHKVGCNGGPGPYSTIHHRAGPDYRSTKTRVAVGNKKLDQTMRVWPQVRGAKVSNPVPLVCRANAISLRATPPA